MHKIICTLQGKISEMSGSFIHFILLLAMTKLSEAIYLIEVNESIKEFLRENMKSKLAYNNIAFKAICQIEIETGVSVQVPENITTYNEVKTMKRDALFKFFKSRPWIPIPSRENPFEAMLNAIKALRHYSEQNFIINTDGEITPIQ